MLTDATFNTITGQIIGASIEVHRHLGPGLLESTCRACLRIELMLRRLRFVEERVVPVVYKDAPLDASYRVDLIVEDLVVVEVKSVSTLASIHDAQVLTYLRLTGCPAALLINFNVPRLTEGVKRFLNSRPTI
jgi:GxxExxY protein